MAEQTEKQQVAAREKREEEVRAADLAEHAALAHHVSPLTEAHDPRFVKAREDTLAATAKPKASSKKK